jgi:hypothetical protein
MALEKSFDKFGSTFASAYHNISDLRYNVHEYQQTTLVEQEPDEDGNPVMPVATTTWETNRTAVFTVKTYVDSAARTAHEEDISRTEYSFTPDWTSSDNVLAQAYTYLKTLDAFDSATDV